MVGDSAVRGLAARRQLDAHFDEQRARRHRPEGLSVGPIARDERGGGRNIVGVVLAIVEDGPRRAPLVHRVEDVVGLRAIEGLHERTGKIEDHAALSALPGLNDDVAQLRRLARAGRADQHRVGLLKPPGIGNAGYRIWDVDTQSRPGAYRQCRNRSRIQIRMRSRKLSPEFRIIVRRDFSGQDVAGQQHGPALVALFEDVSADLLGQLDEPGRQRAGQKTGGTQSDDNAPQKLGPGPGDIGVIWHIADRHGDQGVVGQSEVDDMRWVEIDQAPETREDAHLDELHFVLVHQECEQENEEQRKAGERCDDRPAQAFHHHHVAQANELGSSGECPHVAHDFAARGLVLDNDRSTVEADVILPRHGTSSDGRQRGRGDGRSLPARAWRSPYRAPGW